MNELDLIKQAIERYDACEAALKAELEARQQADQETAEKERAELRKFLVTFMPVELVQYADLSYYRLDQARNSGATIKLNAPGCFPVYFRVQQLWQDEFTLANANAGLQYWVPTVTQVRPDEYGDEGYYIAFDGSEHFGDFMTALGYAAVRGADLIPLKEEIEARKAADADPELASFEKVQPPVPTTEERIADALETIASGIAALCLHN